MPNEVHIELPRMGRLRVTHSDALNLQSALIQLMLLQSGALRSLFSVGAKRSSSRLELVTPSSSGKKRCVCLVLGSQRLHPHLFFGNAARKHRTSAFQKRIGAVNDQRKRDDNKNKICAFRGRGGQGGRAENCPKRFFHRKRHDNKILKVKILLSRNFVVMAQAPKWGCCHCTREGYFSKPLHTIFLPELVVQIHLVYINYLCMHSGILVLEAYLQ